MATEVVSDSAKLVSHKRVIAEREQTIEALRAENAKLHTENAALQKECEEQNASRCELIQENAKLRAENERLQKALGETANTLTLGEIELVLPSR